MIEVKDEESGEIIGTQRRKKSKSKIKTLLEKDAAAKKDSTSKSTTIKIELPTPPPAPPSPPDVKKKAQNKRKKLNVLLPGARLDGMEQVRAIGSAADSCLLARVIRPHRQPALLGLTSRPRVPCWTEWSSVTTATVP